MPYAGINLILQKQRDQESLHKLEIASQGIWIEDNILAQLVDNNLYLINIFLSEPLAMAVIIKDTLQI